MTASNIQSVIEGACHCNKPGTNITKATPVAYECINAVNGKTISAGAKHNHHTDEADHHGTPTIRPYHFFKNHYRKNGHEKAFGKTNRGSFGQWHMNDGGKSAQHRCQRQPQTDHLQIKAAGSIGFSWVGNNLRRHDQQHTELPHQQYLGYMKAFTRELDRCHHG